METPLFPSFLEQQKHVAAFKYCHRGWPPVCLQSVMFENMACYLGDIPSGKDEKTRNFHFRWRNSVFCSVFGGSARFPLMLNDS